MINSNFEKHSARRHSRNHSKDIRSALQSERHSASPKLSRGVRDGEDNESIETIKLNESANADHMNNSVGSPNENSIIGQRRFSQVHKAIAQDIHNSWYSEIEQPFEWAFNREELPEFPNSTKSLRVLVITWNLHGKKPKEELEALFNNHRVQHHIISIGTEECLRSIPASTFYESKSYWVNLLRKHLIRDYIMIKSHSMNALHLTIFVHRDIFKFVKGVESSEVRTGLGKILGNKGGVGISFQVLGTPFLFINCHLASGQNQIRQRNEDFVRIMNELDIPKGRVAQEKKMKMKSNILSRFDVVFWSGDFNYRVNQTRENTIRFLKEKDFKALLKEDQLFNERNNCKLLQNLEEGEIKFPPTYKYQAGTQLFDNKKKRVPSWTDRILYSHNRNKINLEQINYHSLSNISISDHRPVFSQFLATLKENPEKDENNFIKMKTNHCSIF